MDPEEQRGMAEKYEMNVEDVIEEKMQGLQSLLLMYDADSNEVSAYIRDNTDGPDDRFGKIWRVAMKFRNSGYPEVWFGKRDKEDQKPDYLPDNLYLDKYLEGLEPDWKG